MPNFPKPKTFSLALLWLLLGVPPKWVWGTGVGLWRLAIFHGWKWRRELKRPELLWTMAGSCPHPGLRAEGGSSQSPHLMTGQMLNTDHGNTGMSLILWWPGMGQSSFFLSKAITLPSKGDLMQAACWGCPACASFQTASRCCWQGLAGLGWAVLCWEHLSNFWKGQSWLSDGESPWQQHVF